MVTNLGISTSLRVKLPVDADSGYIFGRPDLHRSERGALEVAQFLASECDSFVDIGAHRGLFVFHVANANPRPPKIIFFEPEQGLFHELTENLRTNGVAGVVGFPVAIGASAGQATFYVNDSDKLSSSLTTDFAGVHEVHESTVEVLAFRDVAAREGLRNALVKVDVEGAEAAFVEGSANATEAVAYLIMEMLGPAIWAGLVRHTERVFSMNAYYIDELRLLRVGDGAFEPVPGQYNWLFARETPEQLRTRLAGSRLTVVDLA